MQEQCLSIAGSSAICAARGVTGRTQQHVAVMDQTAWGSAIVSGAGLRRHGRRPDGHDAFDCLDRRDRTVSDRAGAIGRSSVCRQRSRSRAVPLRSDRAAITIAATPGHSARRRCRGRAGAGRSASGSSTVTSTRRSGSIRRVWTPRWSSRVRPSISCCDRNSHALARLRQV